MQDKIWTESELGQGRKLRLPAGGPEPDLGADAATQRGAASLTLGGVFAVMVPPALLLVHALELSGFRGFSPSDKRLAAVGGYGCAALILLLAGAGVAFGVGGISAARRRGRSIALGLAGVLLNGLDLLMWAGAALAWHSSAWHLL